MIGRLSYFLLTSAFLPDLPLTLLKPPGFGNFHKKKRQFSVALPTP